MAALRIAARLILWPIVAVSGLEHVATDGSESPWAHLFHDKPSLRLYGTCNDYGDHFAASLRVLYEQTVGFDELLPLIERLPLGHSIKLHNDGTVAQASRYLFCWHGCSSRDQETFMPMEQLLPTLSSIADILRAPPLARAWIDELQSRLCRALSAQRCGSLAA